MPSVKIPFVPDSPRYAALGEAIRHVALKTGFSEFQITVMLNFFWQEVADQVAKNRVVNIPGFGLFAPYTQAARSRSGGKPYSVPRFSPARAFRNAVRVSCPPDGKYNDLLLKHRRRHHHSNEKGRRASHPFTTAQAILIRAEAQARRHGMPTTNHLIGSIPKRRKRLPRIDPSRL